MASSDLQRLTEVQRDVVRALGTLTEQLGSGRAPGAVTEAGRDEASTRGEETAAPAGPGLERALELTARVVGDLSQATTANTQAVAGLSRELGGLPGLLAGLAGGLKDGNGILGGVLKSGFGLASLGLRIAGLFRGERETESVTSIPFVESPRLALEVANTENILSGFSRSSRGQRGEVRAEPERPILWQPQVTVNVSAMDSRSFLDRSGEIARAVREAMLHMHPVNDLISEL